MIINVEKCNCITFIHTFCTSCTKSANTFNLYKYLIHTIIIKYTNWNKLHIPENLNTDPEYRAHVVSHSIEVFINSSKLFHLQNMIETECLKKYYNKIKILPFLTFRKWLYSQLTKTLFQSMVRCYSSFEWNRFDSEEKPSLITTASQRTFHCSGRCSCWIHLFGGSVPNPPFCPRTTDDNNDHFIIVLLHRFNKA